MGPWKAKLIGDRKTSTTQKSHPSSSSDDGPPTTSRSTTSPSKTTWPAPTDTPSTSRTLAADTRLKRFRKAQCPIVERLVNSLMMHGRNNGKKISTVRIVKHAFEIIHLTSGENPIQNLLHAIINSGPREDSTRIGRAGTVRRQAVD